MIRFIVFFTINKLRKRDEHVKLLFEEEVEGAGDEIKKAYEKNTVDLHLNVT